MNMDIPFKLTIFNNNDFFGKEADNFAEDIETALERIEEFSYGCKELQDVRIKFESTRKNLDLWIEVMDMLPSKCFTDNEEEVGRFLPSNHIRGLYLNISSNHNTEKWDYSPLLPGVYKMVIRENNIDRYFGFLKVESLQINEEQLNTMRDEVEHILEGLAKEVATKRNLAGNNINLDNNILHKYHQIISQANNLIINLNLIIRDPKYKIKKMYIKKMPGQPTKEDARTGGIFRNRAKDNKIASFNYYLEYDTSINNNLKYMVESILRDTIAVEDYIIENLEILTQELVTQKKYNSAITRIDQKISILNNHIKTVQQLKAQLTYVLKQNWIEKISSNMKNQDKLPRIPYHRTVYSIYQKLNRKDLIELNPLENYIYSWKETSKLFEIWGFLKLLLMLKDNKELNINEATGWIFNTRTEKIYPLLNPNEEITLLNNKGLKLIVRYDSIISGPNDTNLSIDNPLLTLENSNRPDFRVDIYSYGYYKGSILADFKYRALGKLGNPSVYINNRYNDPGYKVYSQLMAYTHARTYYLNSDIHARKFADFAVQRVLGIFPKKNNQSPTFIRDTASKITRCSLSPGMEYKELEDEFIEIIDEITSN